VDFSLLTVGSVLFDAVFVPGGKRSVETLAGEAAALLFVNEAYKHCKAIAATGAGAELLPEVTDPQPSSRGTSRQRLTEDGMVVGDDGQVANVAADFITAIAQHRHWSREPQGQRVAV
jgi:catalase